MRVLLIEDHSATETAWGGGYVLREPSEDEAKMFA
jgi:hypothetical protein